MALAKRATGTWGAGPPGRGPYEALLVDFLGLVRPRPICVRLNLFRGRGSTNKRLFFGDTKSQLRTNWESSIICYNSSH